MGYPVFVELNNRKVVIVGGGRIALRKLKALAEQGARITVSANVIRDDIKVLCRQDSQIVLHEGAFDPELLEGAFLVITATGCDETDGLVSRMCRERGILVNNCSDQASSTFKSGALVREGEVTIAVSTGGTRPGVSKWLSEIIKTALPENLEQVVGFYDDIRREAKSRFISKKEREEYIRESFCKVVERLEKHDDKD